MTRHHPAAVTTACHAHDKVDLVQLLAALGLIPTTLIPAPADAGTQSSGDHPDMPVNDPTSTATPAPGHPADSPTASTDVFQAMAVSMHHSGYPTEAITTATGLTAEEITTAVAAATEAISTQTTDTEPEPEPEAAAELADTERPQPAPDDASTPAPEGCSERRDALLEWAEQHQLEWVRSTAARIRKDWSDLAGHRATEQATADAEARVARLTADLEAAQEELHKLKSATTPPAVMQSSTASQAPTPIRPPVAKHKRSREEMSKIRTWAREHGYQVGVAGVIKASVCDAYDAAHQPATLAKVG